MRVIYSGLFSKLKQAGISDKFARHYFWTTGVSVVQQEFNMIIEVSEKLSFGIPICNITLKMGFPNKRISCKRKRRYQY